MARIHAIYGVSVTFTYGWTLYWLIWKLPSWSTYLTIHEILIGGCYALMTNLLESMAIVIILILPAIIFPNSNWSIDLIFHSALTIAVASVTLMVILTRLIHLDALGGYVFFGMATWAVAQFGLKKIQWFHDGVLDLADRTIIFTYISLPLSLVAVIVLGVRYIGVHYL